MKMKFYLFYEDDILKEILNIEEVKNKDEDLYKKIMNKNFNVWNEYVFSYKYEYQHIYEIESNYTLEQLKELLIHDYYIDTFKIANILGKIKVIIQKRKWSKLNEAMKTIKYKDDLINNVKQALEIALQETNNIKLKDKEISFIIYCNNSDRLVRTSKSDIALKMIFKGEK